MSRLAISRAFSVAAPTLKPKGKKPLGKEEITRALKLLSNYNLENISNEQERIQYINYFTKALNLDIKESSVPQLGQNHFTQSLMGLNSILSSHSTGTGTTSTTITPPLRMMDSIGVKQAISHCRNEQEVLHIFEELLLSQQLDFKSFRHVLMNPYIRDMKYLTDRLRFMKLWDLQIMVCSRSLMLKDVKLATQIYEENVVKWLQSRNAFALPPFLEKSLYQLIWKIMRDLTTFTRDLSWSTTSANSLILLMESLPRQHYNLQHLFPRQLSLTTNQQLFMKFLDDLVSRPVSIQSNKFIQQLIKLNSQNGIAKEIVDDATNNQMTVQKYRYINGLLQLTQDMKVEYPDDDRVDQLAMKVHELDDVVLHETVLRFI